MSAVRVIVLVVALLAALLPGGSAPGQEGVGVRIVRDGYGVPHVYAPTQEAVAWGAGYAIAQDRLFQMDVLRHVSKGQLSEIFGPIPGFAEADLAARTLFYTDAERRAKLTRMSPQIQRLYAAYVDGVNAWIDAVQGDPSLLPLEYSQFGLGPPEAWDVTDSLAIAEMLVESFGAGGGTELQQAMLRQHLVDTLGPVEGAAAFDDVRWVNDPSAPVSIPANFDWRNAPTAAADLPPKDWRRDARIGLTDVERLPATPASSTDPAIGTAAQGALLPTQPSAEASAALAAHQRGVEVLRSIFHFGSNAIIAGPTRSQGGGTVQLGGPQVGHFTPEIIAEFGLHAADGSWDVVGLTFAGSGPAVLIGRTPDFAWTTTTGNSDGADIYVESLHEAAPETYAYDDGVESMDCRDEQITVRDAPAQPPSRICRTRHGPVIATDAENGVAYSVRRAWFDAEEGTIEGFFGINFVDSIEEFATTVNRLQSNHNMFYVDAEGRYGYWHPGALPLRAPGTDVRLPQDGSSSATEWQRMRTAQEVPHAVDFPRGWLINWNNKPAVDWDNGDGANYGTVYWIEVLNERVGGDAALTIADVEAINRENSTTELEFRYFRDLIVTAAAASTDAEIQAAGAALATWDARREDVDNDDLVDSEPGYALWKGWRAIARDLAFTDDLGEFAGAGGDSMLLHVLLGADASLPPRRDWLNGEDVSTFLNRVIRANLDALAEEFGTPVMATWRSPMPQEHYTRLNARFYDCEVERAASGSELGCSDELPGNVRTLDLMDRGTYNQLVSFTPGSRAGLPVLPEGPGLLVEHRDGYVVEAESIISPGQSGFIAFPGQQDPHYEDQHELYASWQYKPMPLREADVAALGGDAIEEQTYTFALDPLERLAANDRIGTAVAASAATFETAAAVVIATAGDFPDALAAAPLAAVNDAPLLLTGSALDDRVRAEIERLEAATALVVGGSNAIPDPVVDALEGAGLTVERLSGDDRFATAAAVAEAVAPDGAAEVFIASGRSFPDALAAGAVAGRLGLPILLTERDAVPEATSAAIDLLGAQATLVVGGPAVIGDAIDDVPSPRQLWGNDRYTTSLAVAAFGEERGLTAATAVVATGNAFPDGLAGGAIAAARGAVFLLVDGADADAADASHGYLGERATTLASGAVLGGVAAVADAVTERVQLAISER